MVGRSLADGALVGWGIFITAIIGFLIGFRAHGSLGGVLLGFLLMLVAGYAFSWIFITIGLISGNAQAAQGMSMLVIPFSFISNANVPVSSMPGWMQPFAANQPVSVIINAVRSLVQGGTDVVGIGHTTTVFSGTPRRTEPPFYVMFVGTWDSMDDLNEALTDPSLMEAGKHAMGMLAKYDNSADMLIGDDA